ncbi:hypothetical protein ACFLRM_05800 [Acidobacteriota bacterium]
MKTLMKTLLISLFLSMIVSVNAHATIGIVNGLTHEKIATPGISYEGIIIIKNFGQQEKEVKVSLMDYSFNFEGKKFYKKPGTNQRSNTKWIAVYYPKQLSIKPGEKAQVKYIIKVPNEKKLAGTYWSMFMVEVIPRMSPESLAKGKPKYNFGIKQIIRYGIQIITNISETGTRELKFLNTQLIRHKDKRTFHVDVENTGERWLRAILYVELYDEKGQYKGKYEAGQLRIYPGTSVRYKLDLSKVSEGKYKAMVIVDNKDEYVFGAEYTLDINSPATSGNSLM